MNKVAFQQKIWRYYRAHRRDLPWRKTQNPYRILVSELMLQQTQVARVVPKYDAFVEQFPNFPSLARAPLAKVLQAWSGLGYNRRAKSLKAIAQRVIADHRGRLPRDETVLATFPGIGPATAAAIVTYAFNRPIPYIETNIRRVYLHHFFPHRTNVSDDVILKLVTATLSQRNPRGWYSALMDYGSMLARSVAKNPNLRSTRYRRAPRFTGSSRELRGKLIAFLLQQRSASLPQLQQQFLPRSTREVVKGVHALEKEGLLRKVRGRFLIA